MSTEIVVAACVRWAYLCALAGLLGSIAMDLVVLPEPLHARPSVHGQVVRVTVAALLLLLLTSTAELVLRGRTMAGSLAGAACALPVVIGATHFGHVWTIRSAGLVLLVAVSRSRGRSARGAAAMCALLVALTTALSGHAADWGDVTASAFVDCAHVVAAGVWAGGLLCLVLLLRDARQWQPSEMAILARRFSRLAGWCVVVVLATGAFNAWIEVATMSALWATRYGQVLVVKLVLATALLGLGAMNRYRTVPALDPQRGNAGRNATRLAALVAREAVLAASVFACTAVLAQATPPRHHAGHEAAEQSRWTDDRRSSAHVARAAAGFVGLVRWRPRRVSSAQSCRLPRPRPTPHTDFAVGSRNLDQRDAPAA